MLRIIKNARRWVASIDGQVDPNIKVSRHLSSEGPWYDLSALTPAATKRISDLPLTFKDIPDNVPHLRVKHSEGFEAPHWLASMQASRTRSEFLVTADIEFAPDTPGLFQNAGPFVTALGNVTDLRIANVDLSPTLELTARAWLQWPIRSFASGAAKIITLMRPALAVLANSPPPSVTATFTFPENLRAPCEQYLLHFAEFLRDLSVNVTVKLEEVAQRVLFTVTPVNHQEALENIRIALAAYLRLPSAELVGSPKAGDRLTVFKLQANVNHLLAQLDLARAKNELLSEHINVQRIALALLEHKTSTAVPRQPETEALLPYVSVAAVEKAGLRINLPQLLRDLRKLFSRWQK